MVAGLRNLDYIPPMSSTSHLSPQITVNGQPRPRGEIATIRDLIAALALDPRTVAIERNLAIVPRSAYASTPVADDDAIEIVGFIGGG